MTSTTLPTSEFTGLTPPSLRALDDEECLRFLPSYILEDEQQQQQQQKEEEKEREQSLCIPPQQKPRSSSSSAPVSPLLQQRNPKNQEQRLFAIQNAIVSLSTQISQKQRASTPTSATASTFGGRSLSSVRSFSGSTLDSSRNASLVSMQRQAQISQPFERDATRKNSSAQALLLSTSAASFTPRNFHSNSNSNPNSPQTSPKIIPQQHFQVPQRSLSGSFNPTPPKIQQQIPQQQQSQIFRVPFIPLRRLQQQNQIQGLIPRSKSYSSIFSSKQLPQQQQQQQQYHHHHNNNQQQLQQFHSQQHFSVPNSPKLVLKGKPTTSVVSIRDIYQRLFPNAAVLSQQQQSLVLKSPVWTNYQESKRISAKKHFFELNATANQVSLALWGHKKCTKATQCFGLAKVHSSPKPTLIALPQSICPNPKSHLLSSSSSSSQQPQMRFASVEQCAFAYSNRIPIMNNNNQQQQQQNGISESPLLSLLRKQNQLQQQDPSIPTR